MLLEGEIVSTCPSCTAAEADPRIDRWTNGCPGCQARAAACVGSHINEVPGAPMSRKFRRVVQELFGDNWQAGAQEIKAWAERIRKHEKEQALQQEMRR